MEKSRYIDLVYIIIQLIVLPLNVYGQSGVTQVWFPDLGEDVFHMPPDVNADLQVPVELEVSTGSNNDQCQPGQQYCYQETTVTTPERSFNETEEQCISKRCFSAKCENREMTGNLEDYQIDVSYSTPSGTPLQTLPSECGVMIEPTTLKFYPNDLEKCPNVVQPSITLNTTANNYTLSFKVTLANTNPDGDNVRPDAGTRLVAMT